MEQYNVNETSECYSFRNNKVEYLLSITVALQPTLAILQLYLLNALGWEAESASRVRIMAVAIPILFSMFFVLKRNFGLTVKIYSIVFVVVFITLIMFSGRWGYMRNDLLKFTLPVVIPTGLCVASVRSLPILIRCMQYTSVGAAIIGLLYAAQYMTGLIVFDSYSMAFSYALMFPACILISKRGIVWKGIAIVLMLEMLAVGSRGAFLVSVAFWWFSVVWGKLSFARLVSVASVVTILYYTVFDALIMVLVSLFNSLGIRSRTLSLFLKDELISHDSGRDYLSEQTYRIIDSSPIFGNGVWADRQYLEIYCHNVFLEIFVDFGYFGGIILLLVFFTKQYQIFKTIPSNHKYIYLLILGLLTPLLASSSYLVSTNLGLFLGFSYLLFNLNKSGEYQNYQYA